MAEKQILRYAKDDKTDGSSSARWPGTPVAKDAKIGGHTVGYDPASVTLR